MHEPDEVIHRPSRLRALAKLGANAQSSAEALDRIGVSFADERPLSETDREYLTAVGGVSGLALARMPRGGAPA